MKNFLFALFVILSQGLRALESPILLEGDLDSVESGHYSKKNGETYNSKNWLNPVKHNIFMANNRSETIQFRVALSRIMKQSQGRFVAIDLLGQDLVNWRSISDETFKKKIQQFHSLIAIQTTQISNPSAPFIVMFSSASHNLLSAVTTSVPEDLAKSGYVPVMMEYPGYGASMGTPSRKNWQMASEGVVKYLRTHFPGRSIYLYGHSIGGAVALETAAQLPKLVSGVITHATFYDLREASKDSSKFLFSNFIAPIVATLMAPKENWNARVNLPVLAKNSIPVLFLHGKMDASVSVRHLGLLTADANRLAKKYPKFLTLSEATNSTHEDMSASDNYGPYNELWRNVFNFLNKAEVKSQAR